MVENYRARAEHRSCRLSGLFPNPLFASMESVSADRARAKRYWRHFAVLFRHATTSADRRDSKKCADSASLQ